MYHALIKVLTANKCCSKGVDKDTPSVWTHFSEYTHSLHVGVENRFPTISWNYRPIIQEYKSEICQYYNDFALGVVASKISHNSKVYQTICSNWQQNKHASHCEGIPLVTDESPHKGPVIR